MFGPGLQLGTLSKLGVILWFGMHYIPLRLTRVHRKHLPRPFRLLTRGKAVLRNRPAPESVNVQGRKAAAFSPLARLRSGTGLKEETTVQTRSGARWAGLASAWSQTQRDESLEAAPAPAISPSRQPCVLMGDGTEQL